jgi:hypothetical protein
LRVYHRPCRIAVDQHDRGTEQEAGNQQVPHHPPCCCELQQAAGSLESHAQTEVLHVLEQHPAVAVDDRLGQARRSRGEQHVERVLERHACKAQRRELAEQLLPGHPAGRRVGTESHSDNVLEARQPGDDLSDRSGPVDRPVAVAVA